MEGQYSNCGRLLDKLAVIKEMNGFVEGPWDADVIDELKPAAGHTVIDKTRTSAFSRTDLEDRLKSTGVDQLVIAGVG